MSRPRAFLALLLAVTWCSAAWHIDLEAIGMMLEHEHGAHDHHNPAHVPPGIPHEDHEEVFARVATKDQVRLGASAVLWVALLGVSWLLAAAHVPRVARAEPRRRRETGPPFAQVWQFVWRCAPLSAAPPAWR